MEVNCRRERNVLFVPFQLLSFPMQLKYKTQFMKIKAELKKE